MHPLPQIDGCSCNLRTCTNQGPGIVFLVAGLFLLYLTESTRLLWPWVPMYDNLLHIPLISLWFQSNIVLPIHLDYYCCSRGWPLPSLPDRERQSFMALSPFFFTYSWWKEGASISFFLLSVAVTVYWSVKLSLSLLLICNQNKRVYRDCTEKNETGK